MLYAIHTWNTLSIVEASTKAEAIEKATNELGLKKADIEKVNKATTEEIQHFLNSNGVIN